MALSENSASGAPHAIVLAFPSEGHIIPALQFSETLASVKGFTISFVCAEHRIAKIRRSRGSDLHPSIRLLSLPDELSEVELQGLDSGVYSMLKTIRIAEGMSSAFERTVHDLIETSKEKSLSPPLCIISDLYVSWSQDAANKFNIPRYVFYPSPASLLAVMLHMPCLLKQGLIPVPPHSKIFIPGLPFLCETSDLPKSWHQNSNSQWLDFTTRSIPTFHEASGILVNSFYEIEQAAIDAARSEIINPNQVPIHPIGPILPSTVFKQTPNEQKLQEPVQRENEYLRWLDQHPRSSVLYISFGSIAIPSNQQIQEIAKALDALEGQAFMWVLKLPPFVTEAMVFPEGFRARTQSRGLISSAWAPQLEILTHPSTGGFLSHCGWNSTLESLCSGVPMLPLPQFAEQGMIGRIVTEEVRGGLKVERGEDGEAESKEMERVVRELFEGEEGEKARRRAKGVKEKAGEAVGESGSSYNALLSFVEAVASKRR